MSDEERYLIECLIEECSETIKACTKALRFGPSNRHPNYPTYTNAQEIAAEFQEATAIFHLLIERGIVIPSKESYTGKQERCLRWFVLTQQEKGRDGGS